MEKYKIEIVETLVVLVIYFLVSYITKSFINNYLKLSFFQRSRRKMIIKALQFLTTLIVLMSISAIWGLKQSEIAVFVTSMLTVLGIAFFAQWSLLSNITSSILLFFNHSLKIGDTIKILDKDYPFEGEVTDISYFFVYIRTEDGQKITVPNSIFLQKPVSVVQAKNIEK